MAYPRRPTPISELAEHVAGNAHRPARRWWAPWRSRCACGLREWPCELSQGLGRLASPGASGAASIEASPADSPAPAWNGPTLPLTPLLTRAQRWRANGGAE